MAKAMHRKPRKAIVGPTTIRRVLKISGLKPVSTLLPGPAIRANPRMIRARQMPIRIKLILPKGRAEAGSLIKSAESLSPEVRPAFIEFLFIFSNLSYI